MRPGVRGDGGLLRPRASRATEPVLLDLDAPDPLHDFGRVRVGIDGARSRPGGPRWPCGPWALVVRAHGLARGLLPVVACHVAAQVEAQCPGFVAIAASSPACGELFFHADPAWVPRPAGLRRLLLAPAGIRTPSDRAASLARATRLRALAWVELFALPHAGRPSGAWRARCFDDGGVLRVTVEGRLAVRLRPPHLEPLAGGLSPGEG